MGHFYSYCIIRFAAPAIRGERLNVGLAVFHEDGIDIRLPKRLDKLRAISAGLDLDGIRESLADLSDLDAYARGEGASSLADRIARINSLAPVELSSPGTFDPRSFGDYSVAIERLLHELVDPEPAPPKLVRKKSSRLLTSLKKIFRDEGVLARKGEDLSSHRLVANHLVAEGLSADLALQNGVMHIFETVDAFSDETPARKIISDIAISALVFEQARMRFGEQTTSRLIYHASSTVERITSPALSAAEHQGAELINWDSFSDRQKLIGLVSNLATPFESRRRNPHFHASSQHKFLIN